MMHRKGVLLLAVEAALLGTYKSADLESQRDESLSFGLFILCVFRPTMRDELMAFHIFGHIRHDLIFFFFSFPYLPRK